MGLPLSRPLGGRILPIEIASQTATCGAVCGAYGLLQVDESVDPESLCLHDRFFSVRRSASRRRNTSLRGRNVTRARMSDRSLRHHEAVAFDDSELRRGAMVMDTTIAAPNE